MAIIAVAGRKGGIGKSTIAGNLAGEFHARKRSVAVLDADPQHSLAAWAAQGQGVLSQCVQTVPDGDAVALKALAKAAQKTADIVLIDTPPGMPETALQAMLLADVILLPCGPSPMDLMALTQSLALAEKAKTARREKKTRIRFVPSKVTMSTNLSRALPVTLAEMGRKVLPAISLRVALAEAVEAGLTIVEFAPGSTSHVEFDALAKAVVRILAR